MDYTYMLNNKCEAQNETGSNMMKSKIIYK
jgi:hypothetical protein